MDDLFTENQKGRIAVHLATDSLVIILFADWYKGGLNYKVLVPMKDEKDKTIFCNATYSEYELELLDKWVG